MPSRAVAILGSLAVATALTGISVGVAGATGSTTSKHLHLSAKLGPPEKLSKNHYAIAGTLTSRKLATRGNRMGYLTEYCLQVTPGALYRCKLAFTMSGGIVLASETMNFQKASMSGTVTGGDGIYKGARGTVTQQTEDTGVTVTDLDLTLR